MVQVGITAKDAKIHENEEKDIQLDSDTRIGLLYSSGDSDPIGHFHIPFNKLPNHDKK